ncbi:hypothetical protein BC939DRAFT_119803 [Gamsiella multidivaricata]|uniref:uncharacterized protein n=1 Tax=Gamsiella multidivaricata TaxID=101098 RepID=UPI00221FF8E7|nr:uncharacterized protein BC939DRAFT_119803 [Gamsiella multidivaricata]KAI7826058.1 hypothetical protein BC939DRAFT_119803 [Gamsiella multidivaricata]
MTKDDTVSTTGHPVRINGRSIVRIDDMEVVKSFQVQEDYDVRHPLAPTEDVVFGYTQGSVLYFLRMDNLMAQDEKKCGPECGWNPIKADDYMTAGTWEHISTSGSKFRVSSGSVLTNGSWSVHIRISCPRPDGPKDVVVPLCSLGNWCAGFFLPGAKQLILMAVNNLTVWSLTETGADVAELIESWRYQDDNTDYIEDKIVQKIEESRICDCGRRISLRFRTQYFRGSVDVTDPDTKEHTLTYPHSSVDDLDYSEYFRTYLGMAHLIGLHQYGDDNLKRIICAFLRKLVRPSVSSKVSKNYLIALCESWHQSFYESVEQIIAAILPLDRVSWIPVVKSPKKNNPLNVLLRYAEKQPKAMRVGKLIIEYCVTHAIESKNLAFMSPLFGIMNRLMEMYPKDAQSILDRITFVPVKERSFIIENHRISSPPRIRWRFWKSTKQKLYEIENPIMQLDITPSEADPENDRFTRPTFQASFEALWHYTDEGKEQLEVSEEKEAEAAWWTTLGQMVTVALRPRSQAFVESHDFNLAFFDNPAIAALVTYKWNTIGYSFWLARFVFQSTFYSLVVIAALMQVYFSEPGKLLGLFIAIIVMATMFIWLEIVQALESWIVLQLLGYGHIHVATGSRY